MSASTAARSPSTSASTAPSARFRTQPPTPSRPASSCIEPRNQTPCTRPRMTRCARTAISPEEPEEPVLVERLDAELPRLRELRARVGADDDEVGLLADARHDAAAER